MKVDEVSKLKVLLKEQRRLNRLNNQRLVASEAENRELKRKDKNIKMNEKTKENLFSDLSELVEKLENIECALELPISAETHLLAIRKEIPEIKHDLKKAYLDAGGEDWWGDHPPLLKREL